MNVLKGSGELQAFNPDKIKKSLRRAHVDEHVIRNVIDAVVPLVYDGMPTKELYTLVFDTLSEYDSVYAMAYDLKHAIMALGPTGFPFEKYFAAVLREVGYHTVTNIITQGHCVQHEIDIIATKGAEHYMIEAKFHNHVGAKSDVRTALYVKARFEDIREAWEEKETKDHVFHKGWLVTNTKLTSEAIRYAECSGLNISSWDYPDHLSVRKLITDSRTYPITTLKSLSTHQRDALFEKDIILCRDIMKLKDSDIKHLRLHDAMQEAGSVCGVG